MSGRACRRITKQSKVFFKKCRYMVVSSELFVTRMDAELQGYGRSFQKVTKWQVPSQRRADLGQQGIASWTVAEQTCLAEATNGSSPDRLTAEMSSPAVDGSGGCAGGKKTSWPELVGLPAAEAKEVILKDMPDANVEVVPVGSPMTLDLRTNRVRIFVDTVAQTPMVG
ncbi:hypothetical protein ACP70R_034795 [Stipagrostis hirtigluma subsp. patula]